ncbi:MAG: DUF3991 domain-containing protein [Acutalibacteraceae bacterium]
MRRLYAYLLQQRFIDRDVLDAFTKRGMIYESCEKSRDGTKEYHNAVFVGSDEYGAARHAHKRGLYTQGKQLPGQCGGRRSPVQFPLVRAQRPALCVRGAHRPAGLPDAEPGGMEGNTAM